MLKNNMEDKEKNNKNFITIVTENKNSNTGDNNTGFCNSGDYNIGDCNSGNNNTGFCNSGDNNSGDNNSGDNNSGDNNSGDDNSGYYNSGYYNSGNNNSGNYNSGNQNSGNHNSGNFNTGFCNSGSWNSGSWNSGDFNSGDYNSGDWNNGIFNTEEPKMRSFNKECEYTYKEFRAKWRYKDISLPITKWIDKEYMTDKEKEEIENWETVGGYLKTLSYKEAWKIAWDKATQEQKDWYMSLPNFDADIWYEITGIDVKNS